MPRQRGEYVITRQGFPQPWSLTGPGEGTEGIRKSSNSSPVCLPLSVHQLHLSKCTGPELAHGCLPGSASIEDSFTYPESSPEIPRTRPSSCEEEKLIGPTWDVFPLLSWYHRRGPIDSLLGHIAQELYTDWREERWFFNLHSSYLIFSRDGDQNKLKGVP